MNLNTKYPLPVDKFAGQSTPFYYYDMQLLADTLSAIKSCVADYPYVVHYAVKACVDKPILKMIADAGLGADVVSSGELQMALDAGFPAEKIAYAGVGKTDEEILFALQSRIGCFNVESIEELQIIAELAQRVGIEANVALRVNPEIDAHTHHYITTGLAENKFGIALPMLDDAVAFASESSWLNLMGLHFHIGSQIEDMTPFVILSERINRLVEKYKARGITFRTINVGGGLGIDYDDPDGNPIPDFESYFDAFKKNLSLQPEQEVHFELGRSIVGQCGSLITKVIYTKHGLEKKFVIVDAGMTELIRPALYQAHHKIQNLSSKSDCMDVYDVVGPICESSDVFGKNENLPETNRGDLIAIRSAGAYGRVMSSRYNCRPKAEAVYSV